MWRFVGMNRAHRCDGHKRHQSEGGLHNHAHHLWPFWHKCFPHEKTRPSLSCFRSDAGGSRLVLSGTQARYACGLVSLYYNAVTEPHLAACVKKYCSLSLLFESCCDRAGGSISPFVFIKIVTVLKYWSNLCFETGTASWVRIVNGINKDATETSETIPLDNVEHRVTGKLVAKAKPR